MAYQYYFC